MNQGEYRPLSHPDVTYGWRHEQVSHMQKLGPLPSLTQSPPISQYLPISPNIVYVCVHFPTISCHNQAIILKGVLVWDNSIVPTILRIKPSRVHYFKDWTGCFDINIKHRDWLRVCIKAVLGHSWDLPIIQPRLRMTENHCNPTATWLGLENGLKWPLFFSFRADKNGCKIIQQNCFRWPWCATMCDWTLAP